VLDSGWFLLGAEAEAFEREFAAACGTQHAVVVSSGLDALVLALRALDIGPGDEVLVPGFTFIASWLAVTAAGATPVPVDVEESTCNLDPDLVEAAITPRTRAIMPVHLQGRAADMTRLGAVAERHGLLIVEDAAQAHLASHAGTTAGGFGAAAGFSFYPGKNLGALGDGGAVTTNDAAVAARLRSLRNYGSVVKYVHDEQGVNSRLDELQCAFLRVRLERLAAWIARRRSIAERYLAELAGTSLVLPAPTGADDHAWHVFAVRSGRRDQLQAELADRGVQTLIHYPTTPHRTAAYATLASLDLPVSDRIAAETLSLPIGPHMPEEHVQHVIDSVLAVLG
jgi:dTDP-4-amino-4,6-dideoxygalactose transaminase